MNYEDSTYRSFNRADKILKDLLGQMQPTLQEHERNAQEQLKREAADQNYPLEIYVEKKQIEREDLLQLQISSGRLPNTFLGLLTEVYKRARDPERSQSALNRDWEMLRAVPGGPEKYEELCYDSNRKLLADLPAAYERIRSPAEPLPRGLLEFATAIKYDIEAWLKREPAIEEELNKRLRERMGEGSPIFKHYAQLDYSGRAPSEMLYHEAYKIAIRTMQKQWARDEVEEDVRGLRNQSIVNLTLSQWRKEDKGAGRKK